MTIAGLSAVQSVDADSSLLAQVTQFLALEAKLLDEGREEEWYELLDDELLYVVPIRQATEQRAEEVDRSSYRIRDTKAHVRVRLDRLATGNAYSEIPPSRTMRLVGSVLLEGSEPPDLIKATSALLVYRQRGIDETFDLIPCRRNDTLRRTDEGLRLVRREVLLTEVSIATPNLGVFL
jgi:N,N-dimethyl phenylurea N-demethylase beta subunit